MVSEAVLPDESVAVQVMVLDPSLRVTVPSDQVSVPVVAWLDPELTLQLTEESKTSSLAVPAMVAELDDVAYVGSEVGEVMVIVGSVTSPPSGVFVYVTVVVVDALLPQLSVAVTERTLAPSARVTVFDQLVVPVAVPLPALAPETETEAIPVPPVSAEVPEIV